MKSPLKVIRKEYPKIRFRVKGNTEFYEVDCRKRGVWTGQSFYSFPSKGEAITKAQEVAGLVKEHGAAGINHEDMMLMESLRRKLLPYNITPEFAVDTFIQKYVDELANKGTEQLGTVLGRYVYEKEHGIKRKLSKKTIIGLKTTQNALIKCFGTDRAIGTITTDNVVTGLGNHWSTQSSRKDYLIRFRTFFKWAIEEKYLKENPCVESLKIHSEKPETEILPHTDILTLLERCLEDTDLIPYVSLGLFSMLRDTTLQRINWNFILTDRDTIKVPKSISKTFDHIVPIHPTLKEWLKGHEGKPIKITNWRKRFVELRKGIHWQKDVMRHTAISYFMGKYNDVGRVSEWAGNSPKMIKKHYQVPLLQSEVDWFWSLTPDKVRELVKERDKK